MDITPDLWKDTCRYLQTTFGTLAEEPLAQVLAGYPEAARAAGLPDIAISSEVGRLMSVFVSLVMGNAHATGRLLEVGTLGGYSALWLARAMPDQGHLTTIEMEPRHAAFARDRFKEAGFADRITVVDGAALDVLPSIAEEWGPASTDLVFLDAEKCEYPDYLKIIRPLVRIGGMIIADNALGSGSWWITQNPTDLDDRRARSHAGATTFNQLMANDPDFETAGIPIREGVLAAVRVANTAGASG